MFLSVVNKAGKHMEDTLIASYLTLIIGHLILEEKVLYYTLILLVKVDTVSTNIVFSSQDYESHIRSLLPDNNFSLMGAVLQKFFNFMKLTASVSYQCQIYQYFLVFNTSHVFFRKLRPYYVLLLHGYIITLLIHNRS